MKTNNGFVVPVLLVIIILLLVGGGVYVYKIKKAEAPVVVDTDIQNETNNTSNLKTYTNTKLGYSFLYPEKLSLATSGDTVNLSHNIPFENRDGGCDMMGEAELSKTLNDFGLSIKIVPGKANPPYVDGTYSKGELNGKWAYMGAEGCGVSDYYFPINGDRTLIITKSEIQILSPVVTPEVRAKVLAVPGVISYEESKTILDQILSSFKIISTSQKNTNKNTYTYKNHGFTIELPAGYIPYEEESEGGPYISITLPDGGLSYVKDVSWWVKYDLPSYKYIRTVKIGETNFNVYTYSGVSFYWFRQGNVGYQFSGPDATKIEEMLKTFKFVGWR